MAYILAVNPNLLGASGMDAGAVFTATALASALATCIMALWATTPGTVCQHGAECILHLYGLLTGP